MNPHGFLLLFWLVSFIALSPAGQAEPRIQTYTLPAKFPDFGIFHSVDINNKGSAIAWGDRTKDRDGGGGVLRLSDTSEGAGSKLDKRCELMRFSSQKALVFVVANNRDYNFVLGWNYETKKREFMYGTKVLFYDRHPAILRGFWKDRVFFQQGSNKTLKVFGDDGGIQKVVGVDGPGDEDFAVSNGLVLMDSTNRYHLFRLSPELQATQLLNLSMPDLSGPMGTRLNSYSKDVALHPQLAVENNQFVLIDFTQKGRSEKTEFHPVRIEGDRFCALKSEGPGKRQAVVGKVANGQLQVEQSLFGRSFDWPVGLACSQNMQVIALLKDRQIQVAFLAP